KERIPHKAKARLIPAATQFQCFTALEKCPLHTTQIIAPTAIAIMINPKPNNDSISVPQVSKVEAK
ncbi:MAG: hypothetical protein COX14_00085, partial [Chloroflexi bacterium CG23_combo_of_CG06-09_8_20_14_all_45_10]